MKICLPKRWPEGARIIREFIEDYHEKLDEDFLFPRFRRSQRHLELLKVPSLNTFARSLPSLAVKGLSQLIFGPSAEFF